MPREEAFPSLRVAAMVWLLVYVPSYAAAYGLANFLFLCNLTIFLVALGLWTGNVLLLSSQAVAMLVVSSAWTLDVLSRLALGFHAIGGTEYMWDPQWPLPTRLLSLYHIGLPVLLLYALRKTGYDPRGLYLQSAIAVVVVSLSRRFGPEANLNWAFRDPILKRSFEPPALHVLIVIGALVGVVYPLSDRLLRRLCAPARRA